MSNDKLTSPTSDSYILAITIVATLGGLLFGYDTGVIGGSQLYFTEYFNFTPSEQGWAVSSALYGCLIGAGFAGYLSSKFSRKNSLILSGFLFAVSAWGSGIPESLDVLVVFRIIGGLGVGIASMVAPMYIAEIAPAKIRGRLVSYYQLAIVVGFFVVFLATYYIGGGDTSAMSANELEEIHKYNVEHGWRVMFWSELIPAGLFFLLLFFIPKSPRWLVMRGKDDEAKSVLRKILGNEEEALVEYNEIKSSMEAGKREEKVNIFKGKFFKILLIGTVLSILQQTTGINAILYYGAEIFSNALGYGPEDALKQQILLGFVNLMFTFIAIFTVDRWGRKPLLLTGSLGMLAGLSVLGFAIYTNNLGVISLIGVFIFIGSFALSMGPITWVLLSEMFPNKMRSSAMSIAVAAQWLFNAIVANTFPMMVGSNVNADVFNGSMPYAIFGAFCLLTFVFVFAFIPETKGKSLEELETIWDKK
jgi:MFS transporter, SP family, xylose:H+ symportor